MSSKKTVLEPVSNGAEETIARSQPFRVSITIEGTAALLFHRWNNEAVAAKAAAAKGSKSKKTDDIESYVWRCENGNLGLPGEYLRSSLTVAAKFEQDPRSPRKSAQDLVKASVVSLTELADLGIADWDYVDMRRVTVQRQGITRSRPAVRAGWTATFILMSVLPEYVSPQFLHKLIEASGRLVGVGDFRPSYGRFQITNFEVL